jgi:hypothetical protein
VSILVQIAGAARILCRSLNMDPMQHLEIESRDFRDSDGADWRVQIREASPKRRKADLGRTAVLLLRQLESPCAELSIRGDAGRWRVAEYTTARLRQLLAEAQVRARQPISD